MSGLAVSDRARREAGSATVWVLVLATMLVAVWVGLASIGGAVVARHRASGAADLAALAAASALEHAVPNPCGAAREVAELQGTTLAGCSLDGLVADVVVTVEVGGVLSFGKIAVGRSRAGPAGAARAAGAG